LSVDKIDQKTLEEQKQIFEKEVEEKNFKPEIKEKILSNKMEKFLQESCFLNKRFIFEEETEISVQNLLKSTNSQVFLFHREE
jgi:translation elongation factor EF-Ts